MNHLRRKITMVRMTKRFETFEDLAKELCESGVSDPVIDPVLDDGIEDYTDIVSRVLEYSLEHTPSPFADDFPDCISVKVDGYGVSYIYNKCGIGITTSIDRDTGEVSYSLSFNFTRPKNMIIRTKLYKYCEEHDYKEFIVEKKRNNK
jgi:hypothetical protein